MPHEMGQYQLRALMLKSLIDFWQSDLLIPPALPTFLYESNIHATTLAADCISHRIPLSLR